MKKLIVVIVIFMPSFFSINKLIAQSYEKTALTVGDHVPNLIFDTIINFNSPSAKLSDFKGKLIILDFWSRDCGTCLAGLPHKNALQEEFGNRIAIIPINDEANGRGQIPDFWKKNKITKNLSLPTVIDNQKTFVKYFPRPGAGLQVWIDSSGYVIGLTTPEYVNSQEINNILDGKKVNWAIWKRVPYDYDQPLSDSGFNHSNVLKTSSSILLPHKPYVEPYGFTYLDSSNEKKRYGAINCSILSLYSFCFRYYANFSPPPCQMSVITTDSSKYFQDGYYEDWWTKNTYCYEKYSHKEISNMEFALEMKNDLDKYFGIKSRIQNRMRQCLVISQRTILSKEKAADLEKAAAYSCSIQEFITDWNNNNQKLQPVVVPSNLKNRQMFVPAMDWRNPIQIKKVLSDNGFGIRQKSRKIPILVLRELKNSTTFR